jgi:uncharacterized protein involved in exopolysaccharide biosynthesis
MIYMNNELNIITIVQLLLKNGRILIGGTLLAAMACAIALFVLPPTYKATTTILPGNSLLHDKAATFNPNIKDLYSYFGNTDDIDRILAVANSDTVLLRVIHTTAPITDFKQTSTADALHSFRKKLQLVKTDKDQLLISFYHTNPTTAATIANTIAQQTNQHLLGLVKKEQETIIQNLIRSTILLKQEYDSLRTIPSSPLVDTRLQILLTEINQYQLHIDEYTNALNHQPAFLQIVETANAPLAKTWPSKPIAVLLAALIGCLASCLLVLFKNRN